MDSYYNKTPAASDAAGVDFSRKGVRRGILPAC